jgi:hypothetical protein
MYGYKSSTIKLSSDQLGSNTYQVDISNSVVTETSTLPIVSTAKSFKFVNSDGTNIEDLVTEVLTIKSKIVDNKQSLLNKIEVEEERRKTHDKNLNETLDQEITNRKNAVKNLLSNLEIEKATREALINEEIKTRLTVVAQLNTSLNVEIIERKLELDNIKIALQKEVDDRVKSIDLQELSRIDGNSSLTHLFNSKYDELKTLIDNNQKTQENAVDTITNLLRKEEETRTTELAFEKNRIDNLLTSFNIDEVKLTHVISSYAAADTDIMDRINGLTTSLSTLSTDLIHLKNVVQTALTLAPSI